MASARGYLVDANILLRLLQHNDHIHLLVRSAVDELNRRENDLYFSMLNIF
jgi:predicted nucleic-acid-binding protein